MKPCKPPRGLTLIEIIIYSALLPLILGVVYTILIASRRYLETARQAVDVQQAASLAVSRLGRELLESNPLAIETYPRTVTPASSTVGVVLVSARSAQKVFVLEPAGSGLPYWQKYVAYYLDTDPTDSGSSKVRALYRAEYTPTVAQGFPTIDPAVPSSLTPGVTPASIRAIPTNRRLICHGVLAPTTPLPRGGLDIYFSADGGVTRTYDSPSNPIYVELKTYDERAGVASSRTQVGFNQVQVSTAFVARR